MNIIVPLAGPDFIQDNNVMKPLIKYNDDYMLRYILYNREWHSTNHQYIFILNNNAASQYFVENYLLKWFNNAKVVYLSDYTRGAAYTILAGLASIKNTSEPLIIDLADIYFTLPTNSKMKRDAFTRHDGVALYFNSKLPIYSYFQFDNHGYLEYAAEKKSISNNASVGVYIYKDMATYLFSFYNSIPLENDLSYNNNVYVCPIFNGLVSNGKIVKGYHVDNVHDPKINQT